MPDYVKIRTAQNVEISYRLAGLGNRFAAKALDFIIIIGYMISIAAILGGVLDKDFIDFNLFYGLYMLAMIPAMLYSVLFETFYNGQTIGKNILKSKVVSLDGSPLSVRQTITRWLLLLVDIYITSGLAGLISLAAGDRQQRLGDLAAGTIVVSLQNDASLTQTAFAKTSDDYQPVYTQASQLAENDIRIIKKVLLDNSDNKHKLMVAAADKIQELLNITKNTSSQDFLKTIVRDYNYYSNQHHNEKFDEYE